MDRSERFHLIDQMLVNHRCVSMTQFLEALEVSPATFKRDLEYLRDRFGAPIIWDRELRGYRYEQSDNAGSSFQLPGLWLNTSELQALLMMDAWLKNLQPGLLTQHVQPLRTRILMLLAEGGHSAQEITRRMRILTQPRQGTDGDHFQPLSQALLNRKRVKILHLNRASDRTSERVISPQRLTWYRDNWYLDSWCHLRQAIRSFAIDAIVKVKILVEAAKDVDDQVLDRELASGYGIFSGAETRWAELRFTPQRARWVSREQWHPQQQSHFDDEGYYRLRIPYSQETELLMEILKFGDDVEVLAPESLRQQVVQTLQRMQGLYAAQD